MANDELEREVKRLQAQVADLQNLLVDLKVADIRVGLAYPALQMRPDAFGMCDPRALASVYRMIEGHDQRLSRIEKDATRVNIPKIRRSKA